MREASFLPKTNALALSYPTANKPTCCSLVWRYRGWHILQTLFDQPGLLFSKMEGARIGPPPSGALWIAY
jgi:hypothetical protein